MTETRRRTTRGAIWLALLAIGVLVGAAQAALETWTALSGNQVEAEYVGMKSGLVQLRTADGTVLGIPPDKLDAASRKRLDQVAGDDWSPPPPPDPNILHTVTRELFDVQYDRRRLSVTVWLKEDGKRLPYAIRLGPVARAITDGMSWPKWLGGKGFFKEPLLEGDKVTYYQAYEQGVTGTWCFETDEKGIRAWFEILSVDDGWKISPASTQVRFEAIGKETTDEQGRTIMTPFGGGEGMSLAAFKQWAAQHFIVFEKPKGKNRNPAASPNVAYGAQVFYSESYARLPLPASAATFQGPIFGKRKVILDTLGRTDSWLDSGTYGTFTPWMGIAMYHYREDSEKPNEKAVLWLTVE